MSPRPRKESSRFEPTAHEGVWKHRLSGNYYLRDTVLDLEMRPHWVDRSLKTKEVKVALERAKLIKNKILKGEAEKDDRHGFDAAFDLVLKLQDTKQGGTPGQARDIINGHLRPWFLANCPYLLGPSTRYPDGFERQYEDVWADYSTEAAGRKPPSYLKLETDIEAWKKKNSSPRKLGHDRRYLVMTLKRALIRGWISRPFTKKDFVISEVEDAIGKYVDHEDVLYLLKAAKPHPKLYLQIRIALETGMRISEILHLNKSEVNLKTQEIDLNPKRIKTRRRREVPIPIPEDLLPMIRQAIEEAPGSFLFPAEHHTFGHVRIDPEKPQDDNSYHWDKVRLMAAQARSRAENRRITLEELAKVSPLEVRFHDLRHTAITNFVKLGYPETMIRKVCGVAEGTMRRIYAHLDKELKDRFRVIMKGRYIESQGEK